MSVVDILFEVDELPDSGMKYVANNATRVAGGGALNAAIAIARLGGKASLVARIGTDWAGEFIHQVLAEEQIDPSLLVSGANAETAYSAVMVDAAGERQIINYRGDRLPDAPPELDLTGGEKLEVIAALSDTRWEAGGVAVLTKATREGKPAVVDAEAPLCHPMLKQATHIAFSIQGLADFFPTLDSASLPSVAEALAQAREQFDAWVCVTDGDKGVFSLTSASPETTLNICDCHQPLAAGNLASEREELALCHHPAYNVVPIDTLAAGDVWHGVFTWHLAHHQSEHLAIEFANAAAALKCTRSGGGSSAPGLPEINSFIVDTEQYEKRQGS